MGGSDHLAEGEDGTATPTVDHKDTADAARDLDEDTQQEVGVGVAGEGGGGKRETVVTPENIVEKTVNYSYLTLLLRTTGNTCSLSSRPSWLVERGQGEFLLLLILPLPPQDPLSQ